MVKFNRKGTITGRWSSKLLNEVNKPNTGPDMCKCSECGNTLKVADTLSNFDHHDGWEVAAYTIHECTICPDGGCIEDYFYSKEK